MLRTETIERNTLELLKALMQDDQFFNFQSYSKLITHSRFQLGQGNSGNSPVNVGSKEGFEAFGIFFLIGERIIVVVQDEIFNFGDGFC